MTIRWKMSLRRSWICRFVQSTGWMDTSGPCIAAKNKLGADMTVTEKVYYAVCEDRLRTAEDRPAHRPCRRLGDDA
ncbi:MAG: hypothetical protein ACLU2K_10095 [Clostridia bacterium]